MLDQIIDAIDKWWPNIKPKEALSIIFTTGAPGPGAPTVVRSLDMRQILALIFDQFIASRHHDVVLQWI